MSESREDQFITRDEVKKIMDKKFHRFVKESLRLNKESKLKIVQNCKIKISRVRRMCEDKIERFERNKLELEVKQMRKEVQQLTEDNCKKDKRIEELENFRRDTFDLPIRVGELERRLKASEKKREEDINAIRQECCAHIKNVFERQRNLEDGTGAMMNNLIEERVLNLASDKCLPKPFNSGKFQSVCFEGEELEMEHDDIKEEPGNSTAINFWSIFPECQTMKELGHGFLFRIGLLLVCYCGKSYTSTGGLIQHIDRLTRESKFKCQHCEIPFYYYSELKCHWKKVHNIIVDGNEEGCTGCGKICEDKLALSRHKKLCMVEALKFAKMILVQIESLKRKADRDCHVNPERIMISTALDSDCQHAPPTNFPALPFGKESEMEISSEPEDTAEDI